MPRSAQQLRDDALAIWRAAVAAVASDRLVQDAVYVQGRQLHIADETLDLDSVGRIEVVGAGKAGAGMAAGLEAALGDALMAEKDLQGWINVPDNCIRELKRIHLHGGRPAGKNEPTADGVEGTREILRRVGALGENDLCLCLLSGGGSALSPAPVEGVSLADKQNVTRALSGAGANIEQLNTVRKQLSRFKGGGLARACKAGRLVALIISDVLGDPLDIIASGPTTPDPATPEDALAVLKQFKLGPDEVGEAIFAYLKNASAEQAPPTCEVANFIIGNNAVAVDAAGIEAERRGYSHAMRSATQSEGQAEEIGQRHAELAQKMRTERGPDCLITGGEPVVKLIEAARRGKGGRNQQLALAALIELMGASKGDENPLAGIALLSGGVDGEDGPTDAAGAIIDAATFGQMQSQTLDPRDYLARNDAYRFFEKTGGLIKTGPTHTNVCDVRVVVVDRVEEQAS